MHAIILTRGEMLSRKRAGSDNNDIRKFFRITEASSHNQTETQSSVPDRELI